MQNKVVRKNGKFASRKLSWKIKMFFNRSRSFGKRTNMAITLLFLIYIAGFSGWSLDLPHYAVAEVNVIKPVEDNRTIQEKVWEMLDGYGLSLDEKIKFVNVISCESRWNEYAINKNKDGSFDLGLFQVNEKYHPQYGRECLMDLECNFKAAMEIYEKSGWGAWVCSK